MSARRIRRVALFSGNYNYVRDGANQALNCLVDFLERNDVQVKVYTPTMAEPAFAGKGEIVSIVSVRLPLGRGEYRLGLGLSKSIRADLAAFKPDIVHLSCPDIVGHSALRLAKQQAIPVVASMHTRFETYLHYYGCGWAEPLVKMLLRRFYNRCDRVLVPTPSIAEMFRDQAFSAPLHIWARGVDGQRFSPEKRCTETRATYGFAQGDVVIGFAGRLVLEKGLDVFAATLDRLSQLGVPHHALVVGDGPARAWFAERLPTARFTGFLQGEELARAYASMDLFFNPSTTEAFGNVTLEAMASGVPVVAADATGSRDLLGHGGFGRLVEANNVGSFADALAVYCGDPHLRNSDGRAARVASAPFDWDRINAAVLENYDQTLSAFERKTGKVGSATTSEAPAFPLQNRVGVRSPRHWRDSHATGANAGWKVKN